MRGLGLILAVVACAESDLGQPCPMDDFNAEDGVVGGRYPEVVQINAQFPCDSLVCVSTDGLPAYCSRECRVDDGCIDAMECREVSRVGDFAGRRFCSWRPCDVSFECGDVERFRCTETAVGGRCVLAE